MVHSRQVLHSGKSTGAIVFVVIFLSLSALALAFWGMQPRYIVLSSQVVDSELSTIVQDLNRNDIPCRADAARRTIWVPEKEWSRATRLLDGFLTTSDRMIADRQNAADRNSATFVEETLARSIAMIRGVQSASVHLNSALDDEPNSKSARASVMVRVLPNTELSQLMVDSIANLVAVSEKISASDVIISDNYGNLYSATSQEMLMIRNEVDYQRQTELHHRTQIQNLLDSILGSDRYSLAVNIEVQLLKRHSEKTEHTGDGFVIKQERNGNKSSPDSISQTETVYNKTTTSEDQFHSSIQWITVAAFVELPVDATGRPTITKVEIEELIKTSIGYDPVRGDDVIVEVGQIAKSNAFTAMLGSESLTQNDPAEMDPTGTATMTRVYGYVAGASLILITGIILYRRRTTAKPPQAPAPISPIHQHQAQSIAAAAEKDPQGMIKIISAWANHSTHPSASDNLSPSPNSDDQHRAA